jgi:squalene-hopene/tetraprenyl-beta-curcumene cyclase
VVLRGTDWLIANTNRGQSTPASPIGLYFARLWYFEKLYPIVFALSALGKVSRLLNHTDHD